MRKTKLQAQLNEMGINKAYAGVGTSEGWPVVFLKWNGQEDIFGGYDDDNLLAQMETEQRLSRFKDENLT